jgi:hypothetical protein
MNRAAWGIGSARLPMLPAIQVLGVRVRRQAMVGMGRALD